MIPLVPAVLGLQGLDPLDALRGLLRSSATIEARVASDGDSGTLTVAGDGSLRAVAGGQRLVHGAGGDWEFDDLAKSYDFTPPRAPLTSPPYGTGRLTPSARSLLAWPLTNRAAFVALKFARKDGGYEASSGGDVHRVEFGKERSLARYRISSLGALSEWKISGLRSVPTDARRFLLTLPLGYTETLEPDAPEVLAPGTPFPLPALIKERGKPCLVALVDRSSVSRRATAWLKRLGPGLNVTISEGLSRRERQTLLSPDSPTYVLVGGDGKVIGVWMGYSAAAEAEMEREWREALDETS